MAAWRAFLEAHARVVARLEAELMASHALPLSWFDVLRQLEQAQAHRLRMTELAGAVLLSKSGLTRLIDRMLAEGLVHRFADPGDRRGIYVALTEPGLERLLQAAPTHERGVERHFTGRMAENEARVVAAALRKVAES